MDGEFVELSELLDAVRERIGRLQEWVRVEVDSHRVVRGHHYLGLLEKSPSGEEVARAQGILWHSRESVLELFRAATGQALAPGMTVVVLAEVEFSARYGLSLVIRDIDPSFTVGQRELQRKETIRKLESSGMMDMQKELALPYLPGRVAVISSRDAAGYGDFVKHLSTNPRGFVFDCQLFQSLMQGDSCAASIAASLEAVSQSREFDVVLILRGGGAESDLYCYDEYLLAEAIARCDIPVLTAIGHERDYHVADMVANSYFKTPTALSDFLIEWVEGVEDEMLDAVDAIAAALDDKIASAEKEVTRCLSNIQYVLGAAIAGLEHRVALCEAAIKAADPRAILSQGYVLATDRRGTILKSASSRQAGDEFALRFSDGLWDCRVNNVKTNQS